MCLKAVGLALALKLRVPLVLGRVSNEEEENAKIPARAMDIR
jgi:hypothetical protein